MGKNFLEVIKLHNKSIIKDILKIQRIFIHVLDKFLILLT